MPARVKRTAITQFGLRILRNCKLELEWERKSEFLSQFRSQMRLSRYDAREQGEVIQSILAGWDKMVKEQEEGRRALSTRPFPGAKERGGRASGGKRIAGSEEEGNTPASCSALKHQVVSWPGPGRRWRPGGQAGGAGDSRRWSWEAGRYPPCSVVLCCLG